MPRATPSTKVLTPTTWSLSTSRFVMEIFWKVLTVFCLESTSSCCCPGEPCRQDEEEDLQGSRKDQPLHVFPLPHWGTDTQCCCHIYKPWAFMLFFAPIWDHDIIRSPWWKRSKRLPALMSPRGRRSLRRSSRSKRWWCHFEILILPSLDWSLLHS